MLSKNNELCTYLAVCACAVLIVLNGQKIMLLCTDLLKTVPVLLHLGTINVLDLGKLLFYGFFFCVSLLGYLHFSFTELRNT